jgi:hypothetical protein
VKNGGEMRWVALSVGTRCARLVDGCFLLAAGEGGRVKRFFRPEREAHNFFFFFFFGLGIRLSHDCEPMGWIRDGCSPYCHSTDPYLGPPTYSN